MGRSLSELQPWLIPYAEALVRAADQYYGPVSINSVYRSRRDQEILYDRYRRGIAQYPVAPPGQSLHEYRVAFDFNVKQGGRSPEQAIVGSWWRWMGGKWSERDPVHFWVDP